MVVDSLSSRKELALTLEAMALEGGNKPASRGLGYLRVSDTCVI